MLSFLFRSDIQSWCSSPSVCLSVSLLFEPLIQQTLKHRVWESHQSSFSVCIYEIWCWEKWVRHILKSNKRIKLKSDFLACRPTLWVKGSWLCRLLHRVLVGNMFYVFHLCLYFATSYSQEQRYSFIFFYFHLVLDPLRISHWKWNKLAEWQLAWYICASKWEGLWTPNISSN